MENSVVDRRRNKGGAMLEFDEKLMVSNLQELYAVLEQKLGRAPTFQEGSILVRAWIEMLEQMDSVLCQLIEQEKAHVN